MQKKSVVMIICVSIRSLSLLSITMKISKAQHLSLLFHPGNTLTLSMCVGLFKGALGFGCPVTQWTSPSGTRPHRTPAPVGAFPARNVPHGGNAFVGNILTSSVLQVGVQPIEPLPGPYQDKLLNLLQICRHAPTFMTYTQGKLG